MNELPEGLAKLQAKLRGETGTPVEIVSWIVGKINSGEANLHGLSKDLGIDRGTLQRWLLLCGYHYRQEPAKGKFVPTTLRGGDNDDAVSR